MPTLNFEMTDEYVQVKASGVIGTLRGVGGNIELIEANAKPATSTLGFPIRTSDQPFTFASNTIVWARGSGTLFVITVTPE